MGISFKCEIKGIEKLEKKLNKVVKKLPKTIQESIEEVLKIYKGVPLN